MNLEMTAEMMNPKHDSASLARGALKSGCNKCPKKKAALQRSAVNSAPDSVPPIVHDVLRSPGQPLDSATRAFMEPRFRHDFSRVRVHTDAKATESKQAAQVAQRFMRSGSLQTKLKINDIGDIFEQEADRVAKQVMLMQTPPSVVADQVSLQGRTREENRIAQMKIPATAVAPIFQRAYSGQLENFEHTPGLEGRLKASDGGSPLHAGIRDFMERRFGTDFSIVRLHRDSEAAQLNRAINAQAFTLGRDIYLGEGGHNLESGAGKHLLAHELTHVIQQTVNVPLQANPMPHKEAYLSSDPNREIRQITATGTQHISNEQEFIQRQTDTPPAASQSNRSCNVSLCFLPLEVLLDAGVPPGLAYMAAVHAYIRWEGKSAGFTRLSGEKIGDARVISPEPRVGEPHERCINARLRTIPTPTPGQVISLTPIGAIRDVISYGVDLYRSLKQCRNPNCEDSKQRIQNMLIDNRRGLYDLFDENCETWARNVLSSACMEAPELHLGGIGNIALRILRETPGGDLYHLARILLGKTRPMPSPGTGSGSGNASAPSDYGSGGSGGAGGSSDYGSGGARGSGGGPPNN